MDLKGAAITLDTGALIAIDRGNRRLWRYLNTATSRGSVPVVPTPVLTEAWRGSRQARLGQLLEFCRIEELDETIARRAGELCARAETSDAVDAVVITSAARRGGYVVTSDAGDLAHLASHLGPGHPPLAVRDVAGPK